MSKEAAPSLGFDAGTASDGSLALSTEGLAEETPPLLAGEAAAPPRPRLPTLEGLAPLATSPVVRDFDDPTNPDEAEWELTSELRAKPLASQPFGTALTLPSPGADHLDAEAIAPTVPKPPIDHDDDDDDLDDSDLTSVYVRPEGIDDDDDWNDEETFVAPMASDAAPTAPRQLPPLLALMSGPGRSVPPPPRSTRALGSSALGLLTRPGSALPPPPPVGTAARTSALPAGLLGMVTRPAAAPPPPPLGGLGRASVLPPPGLAPRGPLRPPPLAGIRPPSVPPPAIGTSSRTGVPAPPTARSTSSISPAPGKPAFPPPPLSGLTTLPRASAPPPPIVAPPSRTARQAVTSPFAVESLRAPVARPSAPPLPPGSSIAPVAIGRGSFPSSANPFAAPPRRLVQLGAVALLGIGLLGAAVVLVAKRGSSAASSSNGVLTVTVSGEANGAVGDLTVVADDVVRCTSSPCRISNLAAGTHFVRVTADGYTATAARAVAVTKGGDSSLHFQLSRIPTPIALDARETEKPAATKPIVDLDADSEAAAAPSVEVPTPKHEFSSRTATSSSRHESSLRSEPKSSRNDPASSRLKAAIADQQPPAPPVEEPSAPAAMSSLNINSTPSASIVLDGRPLGKTPISGVKVNPGAHTIVFIGPDGKRKVGSTSIKPGATRSVGVKF